MMYWLTNSWYQPHPVRWVLAPLSWLYRLVIFIRKQGYQLGIFKRFTADVPVIVVGNITVGGTGKTPLVIWLAQQLKQAGYSPGIISRGYGGNAPSIITEVTTDSDPRIVGDEPTLIVRQTQCPMFVSAKRVQAVTAVLAKHQCDVIVSDDGLQHYALNRDIEIVIVDASRQFGNKLCLPAGPLREPLSRLSDIDFTIYNGDYSEKFWMQIQHQSVINLVDGSHKYLADFANKLVHAIAGIGNPDRFFTQLQQANINVIPHAFSDHHPFTKIDFEFDDQHPILMTEKDAVKCQQFTNRNMWYVSTETQVSSSLFETIQKQLAGRKTNG